MPITLVIIAKNSENILSACISSAQKLVSEIVVVIDPRTTDKTETIAKSFGAKTFLHAFVNFSDQKNFANSQASNNWILSLDADEEVSEQLAMEINALNLSSDISAFSIPRLNYFFNTPVYHTNWGPEDDRKIRLFNKSQCSWEGEVHEQLKITGKVANLRANLLHYPYVTVDQFITKLNHYTSSETVTVFPPIDFVRRYILHQGFRDGYLGLFLSYLMLIYHTAVWVKLWLKKSRPSSAF